jgi:hypothetical protein
MGNKFLIGVIAGATAVVIILGVMVSLNGNSSRAKGNETVTPVPEAVVTSTPTSTPVSVAEFKSPTLTPPATDPTATSAAPPTNTPPLPTETPTLAPTNTPPPTDTPIPTETFTATPTPTATQTPPPTNTPTITSTPTRVSPPTPIPEAIVAAPAGVVILRSGPGNEYSQVASLPNGTKLDVLRWVIGKKEWLKVVANSGSVEAIEGYVNTASNLIRVNVDLDEIPPIYEFGPALLEPKRYESRAVEALITFKWQDYGSLAAEQVYSIILVRDDLSDADACYHWQTKAPEVAFKPADYNCTPGDYTWGVGIATKLGLTAEGETIWRDDSQFDERYPIGIGVPHSGKPRDNTSNGGEDDGNFRP